MRRRALLLTLLSYIGCVVVLATAPKLLPGKSAIYLSVPALVTIILLGAFWAFVKIRPRTLGRVLVVFATLGLMVSTAPVIEASPTGTRNQAASPGQFSVDMVREYAGSCLLTPVAQSFHSSSGYAVVSFGGSEVVSEGYCNGVGYLGTNVHASGVYGRADTQGVLTFVDPAIFPATNRSAQSYSLNVALDFVLNGWQISHGVGFPVASSSVTLSVDFDIIDEQGNVIFDIAGYSWTGSQNLASGDLQLSYRLGLETGHTYSAALKFTERASVEVYALAGDASAVGCFRFTTICSADPFLGGSFFCPAVAGTDIGHCQDFEWRSMAFVLTAI